MRAWLYQEAGMYVCADCHAKPVLLRLNGWCGTQDAPGRLPVLVGPGVLRCPVGTADAEVLELAEMVPSPHGPGTLAGIPLQDLPPRHRAAVELANSWLKAYRSAP